LCIYFGHRIYARADPWAYPSESVDLVTGMEEVLLEETPAPVYNKWYEKLKAVYE